MTSSVIIYCFIVAQQVKIGWKLTAMIIGCRGVNSHAQTSYDWSSSTFHTAGNGEKCCHGQCLSYDDDLTYAHLLPLLDNSLIISHIEILLDS